MTRCRKKLGVHEAVQFNPEVKKLFDGKVELPSNVRRTSYMEVSDLLGGTSGCSKEEPYWDWQVMGVLVDWRRGRRVVIPRDYIVTDASGEQSVYSAEQFALIFDPL